MDKDCTYCRAEEKAYRLLTRRAHSEKELRAKLKRSGFSTAVVEKVIRRCIELGYLNDDTFARQRARVLAVNRLLGNRRIVFDLHEKGIDAELSRNAIEDARDELSEAEAAERLVMKRTRGRPVIAMDEREKARLARGLMGNGFPMGLVLEILKKTREDGFDADEGK